VLTSTNNRKIFFLHSAGGTGKTFLYTTLCHHVHSNGWFTLCVASSGIAALLLPGGHTAHSTFSIPVEQLCEDSSCQVDKNSKQADMMCKVQLIIWDEAITQHRQDVLYFSVTPFNDTSHISRHTIKAINCMLQDVCSTSCSFRGITIVFSSDFQQTLPVIVKGG
jgi:hypothetical protein